MSLSRDNQACFIYPVSHHHEIRYWSLLAEKERGLMCVHDQIHPVLQQTIRRNHSCTEWVKPRLMEWDPKGWNESGLGGPGPAQSRPRCAFTAENVTRGLPVQTQRRCSSKGSSVDSSRGVGGSRAVSRVGSIVWVAPRGSWLTSCRGAGGAGWKRWGAFFWF